MTTTPAIMIRRSPVRFLLLLLIPVIYLLHSHEQLQLPSLKRVKFVGESGLFRKDIQQAPLTNNLVAQNEGISRGPWILDPPLPPKFTTDEITLRFKCLWNPDDLCPKRYIVVLRGPTIYSPPLGAIKQDLSDPTVVTIKVQVPEPGHYELFAWPDFEACPKYWRDNMKYPMNRGQVMGTPARITVTGSPKVVDSLEPCTLDNTEANGRSHGRWIAKNALQTEYRASDWASSFPEKQEYIYQPYKCKRPHYTAKILDDTKTVSHILFIGDSVLRGAFCSQIWPALSESGIADGPCKFINDAALYHAAPKDMEYKTPDGRNVKLSFRFVDDHPVEKLPKLKDAASYEHVPGTPTHIVTNLGLWLAPFTISQYESTVKSFLEGLHELYPAATMIWRTTTDVAPMIQCFSDKGMTRSTIFEQREVSFDIVEEMKQKGVKMFVVDAYTMTATRPDTANDGRHWVIESPDEMKWLPTSRPAAADAERAVLDGVFDIIAQDDRMQRRKLKEETEAE
ncbi:Protein of unknown function [Pyronema omphalodes CBS 100304]|uniref:Uncharacterized protein n=1 Tax=Pyronema omphalodes (strain CBS 100304) TaxID=1076935 RepID=U4LM59_PYROM|nr:Protein of unknown function [Pyronema omphalodes CBS 100304]